MLEFLRALRTNAVVTRVAAIAAIGGFLFGYDTGVISGALLYIKRDFHAGPVTQEAVVSVLLIGAAAGALLSGWLADRIGRKYTKSFPARCTPSAPWAARSLSTPACSSVSVRFSGSRTVVAGVALLVLAGYFAFPTLQHRAPWLALAALLLFMAGFAVGLGPVFWLMISEIFPQRLRSKAMSVTTIGNWLANFAVSATFLTAVGAITRQGTFLLYAALAAVAVAFFAWRVPETKGRSLEEIQQDTGADEKAAAH